MIKYKMCKKMYDNILKTRKTEQEKKMNNKDYVCMIVNNEFGLKEKVVEIIVM